MNLRLLVRVPFGIWLGFVGLICVSIPYVFPDAPFLHVGNYASFLLLCLVGLSREVYVRLYGSRKDEGEFTYTIAMTGGAFFFIAALITVLLDPDTQIVAGAPGANEHIPGLAAQAHFGRMQSATGTEMTLDIQSVSGKIFTLTSGRRRIYDQYLLALRPVSSALVTATALDGATLTVTRPTGGGFLAPLLIFREHAAIADQRLPTDFVALPQKNVRVLGFLIDAATARSDHYAKLTGGRAGVLFDVDAGGANTSAHAIGFAADGVAQRVGGVILTPTIGQYPTLVVSSLPMPILVLLGMFGFFSGSATLFIRFRRQHQAVAS